MPFCTSKKRQQGPPDMGIEKVICSAKDTEEIPGISLW